MSLPTPKLARFLLGLLALEAGMCAVFLADEWPPFQKFEKKVFSSFLRTTRGSKAYIVEDTQPGAREHLVRPLSEGAPLRYLRVEVDQDLNSTLAEDGTATESQVFSSYPLAPLDWSIILTNARNAGCRTLALDTPLTWEGQDEFDLRAINSAISKFDRSVLTVDLKLGAPSTATLARPPKFLTRHAIPAKQVRGSTRRIPEVNRVVLPPSAIGNEHTIFSFRFIDNPTAEDPEEYEEQLFLTPAVAKWGDFLIPSFPLAVAMARYQAKPEDVEILIGQHIRVGEGPLMPIDNFGNLLLTLPPTVKDLSSMQLADRLANAEHLGADLTFDASSMALFTDSTASTRSPWRSPAHLQRILNTVDALPQPGVPIAHPRLPVWGELVFLGMIALSSALLLRLPRLSRTAAFSLLLFASVGLLALLLKTTLTWIPLIPVVATCLIGLALTFHLSKYAPVPRVRLPAAPPPPQDGPPLEDSAESPA